jgi:hypothetical protein
VQTALNFSFPADATSTHVIQAPGSSSERRPSPNSWRAAESLVPEAQLPAFRGEIITMSTAATNEVLLRLLAQSVRDMSHALPLQPGVPESAAHRYSLPGTARWAPAGSDAADANAHSQSPAVPRRLVDYVRIDTLLHTAQDPELSAPPPDSARHERELGPSRGEHRRRLATSLRVDAIAARGGSGDWAAEPCDEGPQRGTQLQAEASEPPLLARRLWMAGGQVAAPPLDARPDLARTPAPADIHAATALPKLAATTVTGLPDCSAMLFATHALVEARAARAEFERVFGAGSA